MKKRWPIFLFAVCIIALSFSASANNSAKVTSISEDFEDGQISEHWRPENDSIYTLTNVDDNGNKVLQINVDKNTDNSIGFDAIRFTVDELMDLSEFPYASVKIKTDTDLPFQINLMEEDDVNLHNTFIENQIAGDGEWVQLYFDFSPFLADTNKIESIKTLLINFNMGWKKFYTGTVWLDDFKVGEAAIPVKEKVTSITEDFEDGQISEHWRPENDSIYTLTNVDDNGNKVLQINVDKNTDNSIGFDAIRFTVDELMDLSEFPYASVKIKTDTDLPFQINLMEEDDVNLHNTFIENKITGDGQWVQLYFDFSPLLADTNRIESIKTLLINFNMGWKKFYTGTVWLDDFKVGEAAELNPNSAVNERYKRNELRIYPNPANDIVTIETTSNINRVDILSVNGKIQKRVYFNINEANTINVENLHPGLYLVNVSDETGIISSSRFMKK